MNRPMPGATPPAAHLIQRIGRDHFAHIRGHKHPVHIKPGVHVHVGTGTMYQDGKRGPMVNLHRAHHTNPAALSPALRAAIEEAVQRAVAIAEAGENGPPDDSTNAVLGAPPPMGGMPPPPPPAGLPGSLSAR